MAVACALVAASMSMAAPAGAAEVADCELGPAPDQTVIEGSGTSTTIYPANAVPDALAIAGWLARYAHCLEGGVVTGPVACMTEDPIPTLPSGDLVTIDPDEPSVTINHGELFEPSGETCLD